jgi:hypothetical protein
MHVDDHVQSGQLNTAACRCEHRRAVQVYAIIDGLSIPEHPLGDAVDVFVRREDAERFIEEVRSDESELAAHLRVEEREIEAGTPRTSVPNALAGLTRRSKRRHCIEMPFAGNALERVFAAIV